MNSWLPRVTVHSLAILLSVLAYVLTTRAECERRPPSIAIAWVLGMIALPYFTLPMYLFFGRRKLPRKRSPAHAGKSRHKGWAEELIESFGLPASSCAAIRMHADGRESADALFETMRAAAHRLDVCTYILGDDPFGRAVMDVMMTRARQGVRVRLLLDGVGAMPVPRACLRRLRSAGIETALFSPLLARRTQGPRNLRNHRKMTIADGARLWAGGRNLAAEYFIGTKGVRAWRDLTFDLQGPVAGAAAVQFEADWVAAGGTQALRDARPATTDPDPIEPAAPGRVQFLPSGPDQSEDTVHALLIDACFHARQRVLAVTPYFVPDVSLETALRLAAGRGVKIDLVIPAVSNHKLADFARNRALRSLSAAGAAVHLLPDMIHAKAAVFDEIIAVSGSANLDSRSLLLNYECAVVFYGAAEIRWLADWIGALLAETAPFRQRAPSLARDLCEGLLLTVAYQL